MSEICKWFACVYASYNGCAIEGWASDEGTLNGKKEHCPHYGGMCIGAKCSRCAHEGDVDVCPKIKDEEVPQ